MQLGEMETVPMDGNGAFPERVTSDQPQRLSIFLNSRRVVSSGALVLAGR
jgi:hypothetical protein